MIKVGSDFSGVGAFNQALQRLGIPYNEVFACDMDKYARQTFMHNYGEPNYYPENVYDREIPTESLDIYMTSPPCQAFSLAGKRKGEDDKRGILFYNSHEFIKVNNPRYFIFENVKGLLSDDNGITFSKWLQYLGGKSVNGLPTLFAHNEAVPYHIYRKVLNAKNYGIPQNRERVFIIGIRDDEDNTFSFPKEEFLTKRLRDVLENDVDEKYYLSDDQINSLLISKFEHSSRLHDVNKVSPTLTTMQGGGQEPKIKVIQINPSKESGGKQPYQQNRIYDSNGISTTLCRDKADINITQGYRIRKLTPRECFRLMDFPDTFTWPVSDTQAYKQAGNSICVGVLAKLISKLNLGHNQIRNAI